MPQLNAEELQQRLCRRDPRLKSVIDNAYEKCILGRLRKPEGNLKRQWMAPGECYNGHWIWDSMFVADLLSFRPGNTEILRDAFRVYWDFQDLWNPLVPDYARDMIANNVKPQQFTPFSQSECIIAWGMERIFNRTGDVTLINEGLDRLERYHNWYWRERDLHANGLITVGTYAPLLPESPYNRSAHDILQSARYESFDFQPPLDDLALTPHPLRGGPALYGNICLPDATAFLIQAERALSRLALRVGRPELAERRQPYIEKAVDAMRRYMWDERYGMFLAVERDSRQKIAVPAVSGFIPLFAGVPTTEQANRMAAEMERPDWATFLPLPTVARGDAHFDDDWGRHVGGCGIMWRGDVWNPVNYLICTGLRDYGYNKLSEKIAAATVENVIRNGLNERYHPDTGAPVGVANLGMACTAVTMLFDEMLPSATV